MNNIKNIIVTILTLAIATSSIAAESLGTNPPIGTWPASAPASAYTDVYQDDFNRSDSGTVGGSWTSETDTGPLLGIVSNTMQWGPSAAYTAGYVTKDFGTAYLKSKTEVDVKISTLTTSSGGYVQFVQVRNSANATTATVQLKATGTAINQISLVWYDEAGVATTVSEDYAFVAGTFATVTLEISAATGASTNDGAITVSVGGAQLISLTGLDTYGKTARYARSGMISLPLAGTERTLTLDNFYFGENDA